MTMLPDPLATARRRIRTGDLAEPAMALAFLVALVLAPLHWAGVVLGGALVGLTAPTLRRALVLGLAYGLVVLFLFATWLAVQGAFGKFAAMGQLALVTVAFGLLLPPLAAVAVRGLT
ncbi:hypothetical protein ACKVMT_03265 [Halobacteriales archaeon Cl-PHB]